LFAGGKIFTTVWSANQASGQAQATGTRQCTCGNAVGKMSRSSKIFAFLSGVLLALALAYGSGYLAAIAIPKSYLGCCGRRHATLALVLE
jgi:hypothetical protein